MTQMFEDEALIHVMKEAVRLKAEIERLRMENAALRRALELKAINDNGKITGYDVTGSPS